MKQFKNGDERSLRTRVEEASPFWSIGLCGTMMLNKSKKLFSPARIIQTLCEVSFVLTKIEVEDLKAR